MLYQRKKKWVKIADLSKKSLSYTTVVGVDRKEGLLKGLSTLRKMEDHSPMSRLGNWWHLLAGQGIQKEKEVRIEIH